jgi:hypothetical protein
MKWPKRKWQIKGQSSVEYLAIGLALALALFVPYGGRPPVAVQLADAVRNFFRAFGYFISLP